MYTFEAKRDSVETIIIIQEYKKVWKGEKDALVLQRLVAFMEYWGNR